MSKNMHKNIYQRLEGILQMIIILEKDLETQVNNYNNKYEPANHFSSGLQLQERSKLMKAGNVIRELRKDAQMMALQAGEEVAVWWAKRNHEVMSHE